MAEHEQEREYLLAEFSESFQHLGKLDDRRFEILQFYSAFIAAVVAASAAILGLEALSSAYRVVGVASLLLVSALVSWAIGQVLRSERAATERYRNKLNAIRCVLLSGERSPEMNEFIAKGSRISIGLTDIAHKHLRFWDIFFRQRHCTALYIKVLIDVGFALSLVAAIVLLLKAFI